MVWVYNTTPEVDAFSQHPMILATCITLTMVMLAVVSLRGYVRVRLLKTVGADDWVIFGSAVGVHPSTHPLNQRQLKTPRPLLFLLKTGTIAETDSSGSEF